RGGGGGGGGGGGEDGRGGVVGVGRGMVDGDRVGVLEVDAPARVVIEGVAGLGLRTSGDAADVQVAGVERVEAVGVVRFHPVGGRLQLAVREVYVGGAVDVERVTGHLVQVEIVERDVCRMVELDNDAIGIGRDVGDRGAVHTLQQNEWVGGGHTLVTGGDAGDHETRGDTGHLDRPATCTRCPD